MTEPRRGPARVLRGAQRFLLLPLGEIVTVGGPFCAFKLLTGKLLLGSAVWWPLGGSLLALGVVDVLLNAVNFVALALGREQRPAPVCTLAAALGKLRGKDAGGAELGVSFDVLLSFTLVAAMVWSGEIPHLGPLLSRVWAGCTVLNVLGAGLGRVAQTLDTEGDEGA